MVAAAVRLFQRQGYHATSWRALVAESGAPWGSVQHHFPGGKEELGVAAVEAGGDMVAAAIADSQARTTSPAAAVRRLFRGTANVLEASGFAEGCPVASVALDTAGSPGRIPTACAAAIGNWRRLIAEHLEASGMDPTAAASLATLVVSAYEGSLLMARLDGSTEPMDATSRELALLIDRCVGRRSDTTPPASTNTAVDAGPGASPPRSIDQRHR